MSPIRAFPVLIAMTFLLAMAAPVWAEHHETPKVTPWDQEAVHALAEKLSTQVNAARTAIRNQGATSGSVGSGSRRDFARLQDKARVLDSEARQFRAALRDGKGHDDTISIFERLMLEVRDARVIGRRIMLQQGTQERLAEAGETLRQIGEFYDPTEFERGPAPPLGEQRN